MLPTKTDTPHEQEEVAVMEQSQAFHEGRRIFCISSLQIAQFASIVKLSTTICSQQVGGAKRVSVNRYLQGAITAGGCEDQKTS